MTNTNPTKEKYMRQLQKELHKPMKKKYPMLKVKTLAKDEVWAMDLVDMKEWSEFNDGYKWILNIIDVWSRYAWSMPLMTKTAQEVLEAFQTVIQKSNRKPEKIWVDQGTEFYNQNMTRYLKQQNIIRYSTYGTHKAMMVERLNRTLKTQMWKEFTQYQTHNWISRQEKLLEWYNFKSHSGIGNRWPYSMAQCPDEVRLDICMDRKPNAFLTPKYDIGDVVRISKLKGVFEKGYTANWSQEQYTIAGRRISACDDPPVYYLMDYERQRVKGGFYEPELQLIKYPSLYLVETVVRHDKKNKRMLIKWLGFDEKHNSWIPESDIIS